MHNISQVFTSHRSLVYKRLLEFRHHFPAPAVFDYSNTALKPDFQLTLQSNKPTQQYATILPLHSQRDRADTYLQQHTFSSFFHSDYAYRNASSYFHSNGLHDFGDPIHH
jgi:hypothetical protein